MKNIYRYTLDKSSKKLICPKCQKKTFVGMIDNQTGEFLSNFGRCDREVKCSYKIYPSNNSFTNNQEIDNQKIELKPSFHSIGLVNNSFGLDNNLLKYFESVFGKLLCDKIQKTYKIGTCIEFKNGTIFWQIDNQNQIRAGKIICYNENGKRTKNINWIHSIMIKNNIINEFNLNQCLFGLHLINEYKSNVIALVESEKTACIMSVIFPEFLWLACEAKNEFKLQKLLPIKHRKIVAYPDCEIQKNGSTTYDEWNEKANNLNKEGFNITVSNLLEKLSSASQKTDGVDLADFFM